MGFSTLSDIWPGVTRKTKTPEPLPPLCPRTGKFRHALKKDAERWQRSLYRKNPDCLLDIYRCKGCGDWHVGNHDASR